ncbi:MAG: hypothetical protein NVS3B16_26280 [Vulcanimicrobiaceae bacterium]
MRTTFAALISLTSLAALVATSQPLRAADAPSPPSSTGPQVGSLAPPFVLKTLDGTTVRNETFRGRTLVINVWATWCPPCRLETSDLIASATKLQKDGVAFLGVDTTEEASLVRAFVAARGVPYAQAIDGDKSFAKAYDVAYFPTTYVIDPQGVLRARYIDVLGTVQLASFVRAAKLGRNGEIASPLQTKIDAALADPTIVFTSDPPSVEATAKKAVAAIGAAESLLDESDAVKGNATDFLRTRAAEAELRDRAIAALVNVGTSVTDKALLPRLRGDAARDRERFDDALDAYRAVLALDPKNTVALAGVAFVAARLEKNDDAIGALTTLASLDAADVGIMVDLARAQARAGHNDDAYATFAKAETTALAAVAANPGKPAPLRMAAYAYLFAGRTYAKNGDATRARAEYERSLAQAVKLPAGDARHDMYIEENQEAIVALGLSAPKNGALVSLAPWTGPDLPGSIPNTTKYRLVVAGIAGRSVALRSADVPKGWVASFCTDRVCAPFKTTVSLPASGVKVIEFQLVPPDAKAAVPKVRVAGRDGAHESWATT